MKEMKERKKKKQSLQLKKPHIYTKKVLQVKSCDTILKKRIIVEWREKEANKIIDFSVLLSPTAEKLALISVD